MADLRTRGAPEAGDAVIWAAGLRKRWGVSEATLWRWRRAGKIPPPDVCIGGREGWRPLTIEAAEQARTREENAAA